MKALSIAAARQTVKYAVRVGEAILLIAGLAVAALIWRLAQGPLALDEVRPYLETELAELAPGFEFDIAGVSLSWPQIRQRPTFEVAGVAIRRGAAVVATIDAMAIRLDPPSLFRGEIAVEHVGLTGPTLRLSRMADGSVDIGFAVSTETSGDDRAGGAWLAGILAPRSAGPPGAARLDTVDIRDVTLQIDDRASDRRWVVPGADMQLLRQTNDIQMAAWVPLRDQRGVASVDLAGRYDYASRVLTMSATFDRIAPDSVVEALALPIEYSVATMPIGGTIEGEVAFTGAVPTLRKLSFDLSASAGAVTVPERLGGQIEITSASAKGIVDSDLDAVTLESMTLVPAGIDTDPVISVTGRASGLNNAPTIEVQAAVPAFSLTALTQMWPVEVARSTRAWIEKNLSVGGLSDLKASATFAGPSLAEIGATHLDLGVNLSGIRVHYIDGLPDVQSTDGRLKMDLRQVVIDVTRGRIPDPTSGTELTIPRAELRMGDLADPRQFADFTIDIKGGLGEVLRFIDNKPLEYARKMQVAALGASGDVALELNLKFPLIKALRLADLKIDISADVTNSHLENVAFGLPLDDGDLKLRVTENFLEAYGTTKIGPIRTGLTWRENFGGGEFRSQYALDTILGNDQRPLVALGRGPFIAPYMDGAVRAEVVYTVRRDATATLAAEADFTNVALAVPELGWRKEPGVEARGHADVLLTNGKLTAVDRFEVTGGDDFKLEGRIGFGPDNTLNRLSIGESRIGGNVLAADVVYTPDGTIDLEVNGRELDVTYFWKEFGKDEARGAAEDQQPIRLRAAADRMRLTRDGAFDRVRLIFERDRKAIQNVDFSAVVASGKPFTLTVKPGEDGRVLKGESADAGGVLRSIGLFDDIVGGDFRVDGRITPDGVVDGTAEIEDFQLVDAPLVARVLSVAALTGIADELVGNGMSFSALRVPFSYAGSTLSLKDAEMYGNSLGMTMQGNYRFRDKNIDIEGTLVPAYAINAAFNRIPIVGDILTGGDKGSGIFAATYRWNGSTETTSPSVNPLAALAPGVLRKFFSIFQSSPAPVAAESNPG